MSEHEPCDQWGEATSSSGDDGSLPPLEALTEHLLSPAGPADLRETARVLWEAARTAASVGEVEVTASIMAAVLHLLVVPSPGPIGPVAALASPRRAVESARLLLRDRRPANSDELLQTARALAALDSLPAP